MWSDALPEEQRYCWDSFAKLRGKEVHSERTKTVTKETMIALESFPSDNVDSLRKQEYEERSTGSRKGLRGQAFYYCESPATRSRPAGATLQLSRRKRALLGSFFSSSITSASRGISLIAFSSGMRLDLFQCLDCFRVLREAAAASANAAESRSSLAAGMKESTVEGHTATAPSLPLARARQSLFDDVANRAQLVDP